MDGEGIEDIVGLFIIHLPIRPYGITTEGIVAGNTGNDVDDEDANVGHEQHTQDVLLRGVLHFSQDGNELDLAGAGEAEEGQGEEGALGIMHGREGMQQAGRRRTMLTLVQAGGQVAVDEVSGIRFNCAVSGLTDIASSIGQRASASRRNLQREL